MDNHFLGRGWKFPVTVDPATGRILMSEHEEDIAEAIRVIIWTAKGERVMRPKFGCGIHQFVFERTDPTTVSLMEESVKSAIMQWEPRVHQVTAKVTSDPSADGRLSISVSYVVRSTNNLYNQVYPFYIHEGTN
ncbi:GPW/gp25 family protein [Tumebacillus sp. ITR2]|uniref:GPW/gp25 family protein n=1 Tax=Tumebacillus amylolyticus TaxID=2801339 RepID=A0ABS1JD36_9BACL|nr:GPW/gp25 family protein [Tumebacillus amylolyticus]MBL0388115.1 GPW/gp25 family protein [Tumebacillus amylolyticus]